MNKALSLLFLYTLLISRLCGQPLVEGGVGSYPGLKTNQAPLSKFMDMRFGLFIHWGPVSLRGTEIGWSRGPQVPIHEYDNLYKEFYPALFDPKEMVELAKAAGMKYLVITSKHHDGFCLWDSKYTDYDIMSTPFRRDVLTSSISKISIRRVLYLPY